MAASGGQTSLGPHSPEREQIYERYVARKAALESRQKQLRQTVLQHTRVNRALRVGRVPGVVEYTLNALATAGLQEHFLTVGTHALYAHETACGVRVQTEATATQDIDLLRDNQKYTAINAAGFEIHVIGRAANSSTGTDPHPLRVTQFEKDFWAVQVPSGQALPDGGRFSQGVLATNGAMATMHAPLPTSFVRIKTALCQRHDRDPLKRRKDLMQAKTVEQLLTGHGLDHVVRSKSGL